MRFFAFQKKPLFNRGFRREILKVAIFDPPRKPPEIPILTISGHFWDLRFRPLFGPQIDFYAKNLDFDHFRPPPRPPPIQKSWKMALLAKTGVFKQDLNRKKGGGWGFTQGPPKKAIFGHFCPFWPFLAIFDHFWPFLANSPDFGHFLTPRMWMETGEFWPQKGRKPPRNPPWPDRLYLIIGLLGRKFGICAENEDFSAPPQVREICEWIWPQYPGYY